MIVASVVSSRPHERPQLLCPPTPSSGCLKEHPDLYHFECGQAGEPLPSRPGYPTCPAIQQGKTCRLGGLCDYDHPKGYFFVPRIAKVGVSIIILRKGGNSVCWICRFHRRWIVLLNAYAEMVLVGVLSTKGNDAEQHVVVFPQQNSRHKCRASGKPGSAGIGPLGGAAIEAPTASLRTRAAQARRVAIRSRRL